MSKVQKKIKEYIEQHFGYLSVNQIDHLNECDGGTLNNVIVGLESHCVGLILFDDGLDENYCLYYVNGNKGLSGMAINLTIYENLRNEITYVFAKIVSDEYTEDTELINLFNTFQHQTKTLLEKLDILTYGNELVGKGATIVVKDKAGIAYVPVLNKIEAFKSLFKESNLALIQDHNKINKIYLMHNPRNGLTKIGRSCAPKAREKTLQGEDPQTQIIAQWIAPLSKEKELHNKFDTKRERGEWFNLKIRDLIEIKQTMKEYCLRNQIS